MALRPVLALILFAAAALPGAARAGGWDCADVIEENGLRSGFYQSYHTPFGPPQPIIGPYQIVNGGGFYTGWYLRYKRVDAPFLAPDDISINLDVPHPVRSGGAVFERPGAAPVRVRFKGSGQPDGGRAPFVYIRVEDDAKIAALLAARDWTVTLFDARGQQAAELSWRFPLDMAGLRALHGRHVANMLRLEQDIGARCEPDRTDEVI